MMIRFTNGVSRPAPSIGGWANGTAMKATWEDGSHVIRHWYPVQCAPKSLATKLDGEREIHEIVHWRVCRGGSNGSTQCRDQ